MADTPSLKDAMQSIGPRPPRVREGIAVTDGRTPRLRRRKAGDIGALRRVMWGALVAAEEILHNPNADPAEVLRACNAVATLGGAYSRVYEQAELIPRLEALEAELSRK